MQDQQPTSQRDADPETGAPVDAIPHATSNASADSHQVPAFDPDAFEQAAAQFRPSWDDIDSERLSSDVIAAEFEARAAPSAAAPVPVPFEQPFIVRGTGELDAPPAEIVVPRPPRTPQLDYSGMRTNEGDDLDLALPKKSLRGVWITVALFAGAATLAFALTRSVDSASDHNATPTPMVVPVTAEAVAPTASAPAAEPAAPAIVAAPQIAPQPAPPPAPVQIAPDAQETRPARAAPAPVRTRPEKSARTKTKRTTAEARAPAPTSNTRTPSSSTSSAKKPKRGAGFVSANPY